MTKPWAKKFRNIIFVGMPGTGKTSFGKVYSVHSGRFFLDFERFLEATAKKPLEQLMAECSEEDFRKIEEKALSRLERRHNYVIAMGENTLKDVQSFSFARKLGLVVYLRTPPTVLSERLFPVPTKKKPYLDGDNTREELAEKLTQILEERESSYLNADVIIDTAYNSFDTMKLHLANIETKALNREYMHDVNAILQKR